MPIDITDDDAILILSMSDSTLISSFHKFAVDRGLRCPPCWGAGALIIPANAVHANAESAAFSLLLLGGTMMAVVDDNDVGTSSTAIVVRS